MKSWRTGEGTVKNALSGSRFLNMKRGGQDRNSLLTNYELGIPGLKFIPMWVHLVFDFVAAAFLAVSPFLFGFINKAPNAWLPHIIAGVGVILLVLVSQTRYQQKVRAVA